MNKRASVLVLRMLVVTVLALIIFIPTCAKASSLFRLSAQAEENFLQFTKMINTVNDKEAGFKDNMVFIQDEGTYVYPLTDKSRGLTVSKNGVTVPFTHSSKCETKTCYCICKEYEDEDNRKCSNLQCELTPGVSYTATTGKLIDRGKKGIFQSVLPRRQNVRVIKCKEGMEYCKGAKKGDISIIFEHLDNLGEYDAVKQKSK